MANADSVCGRQNLFCPADFINAVYTDSIVLKVLPASVYTKTNFNEENFKKLTNLSWSVGGKSLAVDKDCKRVM